MKESVSKDQDKDEKAVEKNKHLKKECQDILDKFKKVEEDYKTSIENMQQAYKKRKKSFDGDSEELKTKQEEVDQIKTRIQQLENHFKENDDMVKVKKEQKDLFEKITVMIEKNYGEYIKHCRELSNVYEKKFLELKEYKENSKNMSQVFLEVLQEHNKLIQVRKTKSQETENLKKECKELKEKIK